MTDTAVPLSDEDRLAFPAAWNRFVQPRRGAKPRRIVLDPGAGRAHLDKHMDWIRARLAKGRDDKFATAASAYLSSASSGTASLHSEADVRGAGVVALLANSAHDTYRLRCRPMFDLLETDHGLPFAAAALAYTLALDLDRRDRNLGVSWRALSESSWSKLQDNAEIRQVRARIAADADYAGVVAALAEHRTSPELRLAVSILVPDEEAWLTEVCNEYRTSASHAYPKLLLELVTTEEQTDLIEVDPSRFYGLPVAEAADLLHRLGAAALPVCKGYLGSGRPGPGERRTVYRALAAMPGDEAMTVLLDHLDQADAMGFAIEAAVNFPRRALRLIAERLPSADAAEHRQLTTLAHADPVLLDTVLPLMDEATQAAVAPLTADRRRVPEAPADAVPALLAAPPWGTGAAEREAIVLKDLAPAPIERMTWAEGEREAWAAIEHHQFARFKESAEWSRTRWEYATREFDAKDAYDQAGLLALAHPEVAADLLPRWKVDHNYFNLPVLQRILANLGAEAAQYIMTATSYDFEYRRLLLLPVANLLVARYAADALVRLKTMRPFAVEWFDRHGADAAALLVPDALGKSKKTRAAAEAALRYLASTHGADLVREAAAQYGDEAAAAIGDLVDIDPLMPIGIQVPKAGAWASPAVLPQVLLAGREHALPDAAVRNLFTVLAIGTPEYDYAGVAVVAEACDRLSLARFSVALFEQWLAAGAPSEDGWALTQLAHFADDEAVRLLAPLVAKWPGESQHQRAVKGLKVLGAIGTEAALRAINQIAEKAKFAAIKAEAGDQIDAIAANLGLTADQLADRLVPDFGLRDEAALVLDYGPRQFTVGFDEALKPFVRDGDGKPRKSLPKPGAKDDELLAAAAYQRFAALRKDLRTVAADQVKRFERAMVQGRTWTPAEFDEHFVQHPLVWHLARRLVWIAEADGRRTSFRLAEDKGCTDVEEEEFTLPANAAIRLAHPAIIGDELDAWGEILADYEILQPFPQLERPVLAFTEEELQTGRLKRFEGITVPVGKLLGLTSKGWERAVPQDAGIEPGMSCEVRGAGYLVLDLDPGIWVGAIEHCPDQRLRTVLLAARGLTDWTVPPPKTGFGPVDPVVASEVLAALSKAAGVA
ncbi:DUF4132 domain-containing protein [Glycomyces tritici]|uniref:DUF4132 domain-containing protein n=1 Tax=Glycomyces tritici TaxID=2665176 RepID=A0ABT7YKX2_9ACTN|nr:DUF4132 domain-containing protein [Glycomyces tritici]MDN3239290.1 DUF4132 domain-containing protein [Glycomyces tritici]